MGVGIGGDYPLSAVISSEFASTRIRGRMMTATFAAQGFGNFGMLKFHFAKFSKTLIENLPSCRSRRPYRRPRLQERHHFTACLLPNSRRLLLASPHRSRMCSWCYCPLLPSHYHRNPSFHS